MKPFQAHLFTKDSRIPTFIPPQPFFIHNNKRYLNFMNVDCLSLKSDDYLKETARTSIEAFGIIPADGKIKTLDEIQKVMTELKKLDSLLLFPGEVSAIFAILSIFNSKMTFFVDYETSPSIIAVLEHRNVEYYNHSNIEQITKILGAKSEKVIFIDGIYEWVGNISPINELINVAKENECIIVANELNSFGLLGRNGRGFVDLFNIYDDINIEIGSFHKFLGGFGCYVGAKKYLINKIRDNVYNINDTMPQFMLAVNLAGLEVIKQYGEKKSRYQQLWKSSRYFITRLKQMGFKTRSETPIVVVSFNNNQESQEFMKRLITQQIIAALNKERIRFCLSVEHSKDDLDFCLDRLEQVGQDLGLL